MQRDCQKSVKFFLGVWLFLFFCMFAKIPKKTIISVLHWHCYWIWMEWTKLLEIVLNLGIFWQRYLQEILQVFGLPLDLNVKVFLRKTKKERSTDIGEMLLLQQMWDFWPWPDDMRNVSHLFPPSLLHFVSPQSYLLLRSVPVEIGEKNNFDILLTEDERSMGTFIKDVRF